MTADHRQNPKLLWGIVAGLVLAIAVFFAISQWLLIQNDSSNVSDELDQPVPTQQTSQATAASTSAASEAIPAATSVLVQEDILTQPITENASLAQEELAKLNDLQAQLTDQEKTLQSQHADADQLLALKEEQIKLLEKQLAAQ
jgi:uncharacterized protein YcbK (DUF882 family)